MTTPTTADLQATWTNRRAFNDGVTKAAIALLADGRPATPRALHPGVGIVDPDTARRIARAYVATC